MYLYIFIVGKLNFIFTLHLVTATATTSTTLPGSTSLTSTASTSAISTTSSLHKKSSKTGANNSIRSIRSFLEDGKKSTSCTSSSSFNTNHDASASPCKGANRKAFRRRTYSFPPGSGNPNASSSSSSKLDLLETENSRTWLGSLISNRHHRTYSTKALIEAHRRSHAAQYGHNGEIILSVQQNELVFKAAAILKKEAIVGDSDSLKKTESSHSIDFLKKGTQTI